MAGALRRGSIARPILVLAVAILALLSLCFKSGIRGDGIGYYAYLPTVIAEHSVNPRPVFDRFLEAGVPVYQVNLEFRLPNGKTADYKQVGSALMALPAYGAVYLALGVTGLQDPVLGAAFEFAFTAASLFYVLLALFLLFQFLRAVWDRWSAGWSLAAVILGTPLVAYILFEPSYSHTFSVAAVIIFALYLYATGPRRRWWQALLLGLMAGVMTLTHLQEVLFIALLPAELVWTLLTRRWSVRLIPGYALAAAGFGLGVLPQVVVDRLLFDQWLPPSAPNITLDFLHPHLVELLASTHHGWLLWSPLVIVGLLGLPLAVRRLGWFAVALILIAIGELWFNAALSDWWGGLGFGARRLTDQTLVLALGYSALFSWLRTRAASLVRAAVAVGIGWTVLLMAQFYYIIRDDIGPAWHDLLIGQLKAIAYVPRLFIQGTAVRSLAGGDFIGGLAVTATLAIVLIAAALTGRLPWRSFQPAA